MSRLFISYRRYDTQDITDRVYERLAVRFGEQSIFMDVDAIPLGADFRKILREAVAASSDHAVGDIGRQMAWNARPQWRTPRGRREETR